jgi:hypothetical protein
MAQRHVASATARAWQAGTSAAGTALATAIRGFAAVRPASKPLHPSGAVVRGRLERRGSTLPSGVPWIDEVGQDDVVVRLSRAIGLPDGVPDIHGLAMRVHGAGAGGDVLLASTGWSRLGRFVLTFGGNAGSRPLTTLLPYRAASGAILLGARALDTETYDLAWARPRGEWHDFARLHLSDDEAPDRDISFDPVRNQIPGLDQYPWVVRLREPAYLTARRSRSDGG